jgi:4-hydroxy-tetrahydrodipicolinate synthase
MREQFLSGDVKSAISTNQSLTTVFTGVMSKMPGVMAVKAALSLQGLVENVVRLPLVSASATQIEQLKIDLVEGGLSL